MNSQPSTSTAPRFYPAASTAQGPGPLGRYLPPLPPGMVAGWLAANVPPGSWLLDPLGASPAAALEAARAGYRVLVASNNPILSFMLETLARAPKRAAFQAALAELGAARRGDERLERHIQDLYRTECDTCAEAVPAHAFLWRKGEAQPFARLYRCPRCGESGERPVTSRDLERLAAMGGDRMQRARALQRVLLNEEEHRADVEAALENYLARPLYVLVTLSNRIEGLGLPAEQTRLLQALLVSAFDAGTALWPWPGSRQSARARPKLLTTPPQFRENNLWMALEEALEEWTQPAGTPPVEVTHWPKLPGGTSGVCLFHGRVKALMPLPETLVPGAVLTVFPRPNQALWTLSVLWTGWLWGAEAALPLRNVLDRRRYDWNWHTSAVHGALAAVGGNISAETPLFGILPELAPGFLGAVVVAAEAAGFRLDGLALRADILGRSDQDTAQGLWRPGGPAGQQQPALSPAQAEAAVRASVQADLLARSEPAAYQTVYAAALEGLAQAGAIPRSLNSIPGDLLTRTQAAIARTFADRSFLRLYGARAEKAPGESAPEEERGAWWLNAPARAAAPELPLADRVEMEVVRALQRSPELSFEVLEDGLCAQFPGLLSPPAELVRACLDSYAESATRPEAANKTEASGEAGPHLWRLRPSESAAARKADLQEMRAAVEAAGARLGFETIEREGALVWQAGASASEETWWFFRMASSIFSRYIYSPGPEVQAALAAGRCLLVLPGGRAGLVRFKLRRDLRLAEAARAWRFLKFRSLREIITLDRLDRAIWAARLEDDPLTEEATQMALFL